MNLVSVLGLLFAAIAAGASLVTVTLTIGYRREERRRVLSEALIAMISATERHPGVGVDTAWDARLTEAIHQVERAAALSLVGLSVQISEPILGLMDPEVHGNPGKAFELATVAFERLLDDYHRGKRFGLPGWKRAPEVDRGLYGPDRAPSVAPDDPAEQSGGAS